MTKMKISAGEYLSQQAPEGSSVKERMAARIRFASAVVDALPWVDWTLAMGKQSAEDFVEKVVSETLLGCAALEDESATALIAGMMTAKRLSAAVEDENNGLRLGEVVISNNSPLVDTKIRGFAISTVFRELGKKAAAKQGGFSASSPKTLLLCGLGSQAVGHCERETRDALTDWVLSIMEHGGENKKEDVRALCEQVDPLMSPHLGSLTQVVCDQVCFWLSVRKGLQRDNGIEDFMMFTGSDSLLDFLPQPPELIASLLVNKILRNLDILLDEEHRMSHLKTILPDALRLLGGEKSPLGQAFIASLKHDFAGAALMFASGFEQDALSIATQIVKADGAAMPSTAFEKLVSSQLTHLAAPALACVEIDELKKLTDESVKPKPRLSKGL